MRRIYQIIILVVAFISLLAFLAYKHEYDRLKNILQVLNTFGHDPRASKNCISGSNSEEIGELTTKWNKVPYGEWRQFNLGEEGSYYYLYSAFWNRTERTVRIHGITNTDTELLEWNRCSIYNDNFEPKLNYRLGSLKIERDIVKGGSKWVPISLRCELPSFKNEKEVTYSQPIAVSFLDNQKRSSSVVSIEIEAPSNAVVDSITICATVTNGILLSDEGIVVQFIEYHRYVGVHRFVIYTDGFSLQVHRRIHTLASKYRDVRIEILPWNVPFSTDGNLKSASNAVMKRDCLDRVEKTSENVLFLDVHELIVSRYHSRIVNFVKDETNVVEDPPLGGLNLKRRFFCLEFDDDPKQTMSTDFYVMQYKNDLISLPPMFTKTKWIDGVTNYEYGNETHLVKPSSVDNIPFGGVPILSSKYSFRKVDPEFACIHSYVHCNSDSNKNLPFKPINNGPKYDDIVIQKIKTQLL